jgi:hypothetical protein
MSDDPKRWLDGGEGAPEGARELLAHARRTSAPDKAALALSAAALIKLGTQPASAAAAALSKLSGAPSAIGALPLAGKVALAATAIAVVAVVGTQVVPQRAAQTARAPHAAAASAYANKSAPPRAEALPAAPAAALVEATTAVPADHHAQVSVAPAHARVVRAHRMMPSAAALPAPQSASDAPEDSLALEVRWLDQARSLLATEPAAALARADGHAQRFPEGALSTERELIAIDALLRLGRERDARVRADAFSARHPSSLYRERLQHLLHAPAR